MYKFPRLPSYSLAKIRSRRLASCGRLVSNAKPSPSTNLTWLGDITWSTETSNYLSSNVVSFTGLHWITSTRLTLWWYIRSFVSFLEYYLSTYMLKLTIKSEADCFGCSLPFPLKTNFYEICIPGLTTTLTLEVSCFTVRPSSPSVYRS